MNDLENVKQRAKELESQFGEGARYVVLEILDSCKKLKDSVNFEEQYIFWSNVLSLLRKQRVLVVGHGPTLGHAIMKTLEHSPGSFHVLDMRKQVSDLANLGIGLSELTEDEVSILRRLDNCPSTRTIKPTEEYEFTRISDFKNCQISKGDAEKKLSQQGWKNKPKYKR